MNIKEHTFLVSCAVLLGLVGLKTPAQPVFSLILVLYFPGVFITSVMKKELDVVEVLFLPFLFGISFWIVFSYFVSEANILHWAVIVVISLFSSICADRQHIKVTYTWHELPFLLVCCLFVVSYSYPWSQFYGWVPPGDDMKYHVTHIENIATSNSLPEDYGRLYPEVDILTYPLGYHTITALASMFSTTSLPSIVSSTLFILFLSCFSFYFLGKTLFNKKTGVYSVFSLSFLSLFFHRLLYTSTYPNVLAICLQVFALSLLFKTVQNNFDKKMIVLTGLAFAASGETHSYIFLLNILFLSFLFGFFIFLRDFSRVKILLCTGVGFLLLMIPYILRLRFEPPSTIEIWTYTVWYTEDSIRSLSDLIRNISILSPLLLFFGILGGITLKRNQVTELVLWILAILLIPFLSFLQIQYPGWYSISPNRIFLYLFAPLCILSGKFFSDLEQTLSRKKFLSFIVITVLFSSGMHHVNLFNSFLPDPVSEVQMNPDDHFIMQWLIDHTDEDTIILNTGPTVDCSSWIPIICKRRVVFPSFSGHRGDKCIEKVGAHKKRVDLWIVAYVPDSHLALQILKRYSIEYIYIPAWKKRWFLDLYPEKLVESPLYQLVVKKGNAYLFKVNYDEEPETTYFTVMSKKGITMKGDQLFTLSVSPVLSADVQGTFFLEVQYTDSTYGQIDIKENSNYLGTILKYKTGEEKSMIYPLSELKAFDLLFYPEFDFHLEELNILFGLEDAIKISEHIGLKGKWAELQLKELKKITVPSEDTGLRIYLFNVCKGELIIRYEDTGYGNVDINVSDALGKWHAMAVIYRENSGEIKEVRIPIDREYSVFVLGVYVHGDHFTIAELQYTKV
ncbi:MAG: hypothetical protein AYK19_14645 [Theionarchaea archaeon DG-70-1]|nr:MAG: hypothetical protein AYK19_14645 [Theionarchaea archaeon DG-70-1]